MIDPVMRGVPTFRSAFLEGGIEGGALPQRRLGRMIGFSFLSHAAALLGLFVLSLLSVGGVPEPPIVIRFLAAPPPPSLVPRREPRPLPETPRPPPPARPAPAAPLPRLVVPQEIVPPAPQAPPPPKPEPLKLQVDPAPRTIQVADNDPVLRVRDVAPGAPRAAATIAPVGAGPALPSGSQQEPDLAFLTPGKSRPRGPGGGPAGPGDGLPAIPGGDPIGGGRPGNGRGGRGGAGDGSAPGTESAFTPTGLAAFLGNRYGVALVEATRLGQRTSDGSRYSMLLPMLSEAYRSVAFRGRRRAPTGDAVESVQADTDAVVIRYKDGTLHVIVPTRDGLVALYVSADARASTAGAGRTAGPGQAGARASGGRSKVEEAERALAALQRFARGGIAG